MKTKEQKRQEAIARLEREPRWNLTTPEPQGWREMTRERRSTEAARLRAQFGWSTSAARSAS
jgi:hypothetical protein